MANDSRNSRLLGLPAELRNNIYRLALVEGEIITPAQGSMPSVPPLLSTNRQIQAEAASIYVQENMFAFDIDNLDGSKVTELCSAALVRRHRRVRTGVDLEEPHSSSWSNLKIWLRAFYAKRSLRLALTDRGPDFKRCAAAGQLFDVVGRFMDMSPKPSWNHVVESQLESMRLALAAVDTSGVWS